MSRKTVDLKPCPFCGSTAEGHIETQGSKWGAIVCGACAAQGPEVRTVYQSWPKWREDAAVEWNTRPSSDASRLTEAVRDALTELIHDVDCGTLPRGATGHVIEAWRDTHYPTPEGKP